MKKFGPGALVAAAFIGPGTVTVCTVAGVNTGYQLLWVMLISIFITLILQEMSLRLGLASKVGLSSAIRKQITNRAGRTVSFFIIISAIFIGNAAYEAGNIAGASLGLQLFIPRENDNSMDLGALVIGVIAFAILWIGKYSIIEKLLIALVGLMAVCFLYAMLVIAPPIEEVLTGIFFPSIPQGKTLLVLAIIGTTVVPYNLFLHAATVNEKWRGISDLKEARTDNLIAIIIGGLVSTSIIIVAAGASSAIGEVQNASDLAKGIEPVFGRFSKYGIAVGLMAAGISSAVTAPLAAAYTVTGLLNDKRLFRPVWIVVLFAGITSLSLNYRPVIIIQFAQVANAILLPTVAFFLLFIVNKTPIMGSQTNGKIQNALGVFAIVVTLLLSYKAFTSLF